MTIEFDLVDSANIVASGENTTAQLTPPATKDTGDFQAGHIQDDENPADAIDLVSDKYTEVEWCIKATDAAEVDATYEFRITKYVGFDKTSLISWWDLEETSGTRSDAHGTNHLTDNNTVLYAVGKVGNAADFVAANSESLSIIDNPNLSMGTGVYFTLGCWVRFTNPSDNWNGLMVKYTTNFEYILACYFTVGVGNWRFFASPDGTALSDLNVPYTLAHNTWYFVVAWYDGVNLNLQINDGTIYTLPYTTDVYDGVNSFEIGSWTGGTGAFLNGYIDSPFVAKRVYSADERTWLFNSGAGRAYSEL